MRGHMARWMPMIKILFFVIIGIFVLKFLMGWVTAKWPNVVTKSVDTVIQSV